MALKVGELFATVSLDDSNFQSGAKTIMNTVGKLVGVTSLFALGKESISSYAEFESAFTGVMKTVEETATTSYEDLQTAIIGMTEVLPASASEIAGVMEAAGQLGISADDIVDFTRTMIDMGESTNLSAEDAATTLARLANIMGTDSQEFDNLGSAIVGLGNNFATTEREIAEMALRMAGAGKQIGLSEAEVLGFATALSSLGIETEAGGSAFSRFISDMNLAVSGGGADLEDFASVAQMTAEEFANAFSTDPVSAITAFITGLGQAEDGIGVLSDMGIEEIRMTDMLLRAASASETLGAAVMLGSSAYDENNALTEEAEKRYATLDSQIETTKNNLKDLFREFGETMLPAVQLALDAANSLIDGISKIFNEVFVEKNFTGALDMLTSFGTDLSTALQNFITDTDWSAVGTQIGTLAGSLLDMLAANITAQDGTSIIENIGDVLFAAVDGLGSAAASIVRSFITWLITDGGWKTLGRALLDLIGSAFNLAIEGAQAAAEAAGEIIIATLTPGLHAESFDVQFSVTPELQMLDLTEEINMIIADVESMLDDGIGREEIDAEIQNIQFNYGLNNSNMQAIEDSGFITALQDAVNAYFSEGIETEVPVEAEIQEPDIKTPVDGTVEEIQKYYQEELARPVEEITVTADQALVLSEDAKAQFGQAGVEAGNTLMENAAAAITNTSGIEGAIAALSTAANNAAASAMKSAGTNAGKMFSSGIAAGILSGKGIIANAARSVAQAAIDAANAKLKIASPSRVMEESGGYFSEGFAQGILSASNLAASAAENMAGMAVDAVSMRRPMNGIHATRAYSSGVQAVIDYDLMAEAMSHYNMNMYVNDKRFAQLTAASNARVQNRRSQSMALGYGMKRR